jgi:hypothetical protein
MKYKKGDLIQYDDDLYLVAGFGGPQYEDCYKIINLTKQTSSEPIEYPGRYVIDFYATKVG